MSDLSPLYSIAERFLREGVEPIKVARCLDLPVEQVELLPAARTPRVIDAEDIPNELGALIGMAFDEAREMILNGTPAMKLRVIQTLVGKSMQSMRSASPRAMQDLRDNLERLTSSITNDNSSD
jgi:hypothetical protein